MSVPTSFETHLESFENETQVAAQFLYAYMTVQYAASTSKALHAQLNKTPRFWNTHAAACQTAAYISLGRIFDTTSKFNIHNLLDQFEKNLNEFSTAALGYRKKEAFRWNPKGLSKYLSSAYVPTKADVDRFRKRVSVYNEIYQRAIKPARHKVLAHREKHGKGEIGALFSKGTVGELWRLVTFLRVLYRALWGLYNNGHKPGLRLPRYSVRSMYLAPAHGGSPIENVVADTKILMTILQKLNT